MDWFPGSDATSLQGITRRSATIASFAPATATTNVSAAALSQAAAAASSQALAATSNPTEVGSEVEILAQIIIAIGVIPVQLIIVTVVLLLHKLCHRRPARPLQSRVERSNSSKTFFPFLQPKAELEDEQRRRHELYGEDLVHELDGGDEVCEIADETNSLDLPLQGRQEIHEMPERTHVSWAMPLQGRNEVVGGEVAKELE